VAIVLGSACGASSSVERVGNIDTVERNNDVRPTLSDAAVFRLADTDEESAVLVAQAVAAAQRGNAETFVFDVGTSVGFGCKCPPFHIGAAIWIMPRFSRGVPDPEDFWFSNVSYRFLGRFDGRRISATQWRREAGKHHTPGEMDTGWEEPAPALVVDDWCLVPNRPFFRNEASEEDIARMQQQGRLCAGAVVAFEDAN
jgi:hypothetical protein